jgi:hypothetical protein
MLVSSGLDELPPIPRFPVFLVSPGVHLAPVFPGATECVVYNCLSSVPDTRMVCP